MQLGACLGSAVAAAGFELADAVNVGDEQDHRIPDVAVVDPATVGGDGVWLRSAVLVAEIRSPGAAHEEKLAFYLAHDVAEAVLIDPARRTVRRLAAATAGGARWTRPRRWRLCLGDSRPDPLALTVSL